jgi:DNA polymerase-3 subunit alpha
MAYLKANYPKYFISILTTSVIGSESNMREYIFEANKLGVSILKPSINESTAIFEPKGKDLLYPLLGIKFVGINAVQAILEERENGLFETFIDAVRRLHKIINKRVFESLIQAGAFDLFGYTKRSMLEQLDNVIHYTQFGNFIQDTEFVLHQMDEYDYSELEHLEQSVLGFNLFVNPLKEHRDYIKKHNLLVPADIEDVPIGQEVRLVGILQSLRTIVTKRNQPMAFITLSDSYRPLTGVLFTRTYAQYKDELHKGEVYLVKGTIDERNNERQLIVSHVHRLSTETYTSKTITK